MNLKSALQKALAAQATGGASLVNDKIPGQAAAAIKDPLKSIRDKNAKANDLLAALVQQAQDIAVPTTQVPTLAGYRAVGGTPDVSMLNYSLSDPRLQGASSFDQIQLDPRLADAQYASLSGLQDIVNSGGLRAEDVARLAEVQRSIGQADRGRREAILQNMNARGMGGSGQELLAQLQSAQGSADLASQQGLDIAGQASRRALDALMQSGQLAGQVRGQAFGEQAQRAAAADVINNFNSRIINDFNMQRAAQMQAANAQKFNALADRQQNKQNLANANVDIINANKSSRAAAPQQDFQNALAKMSAVSSPMTAQSGNFANQAMQDKQTIAGILSAAIQAGAQYAGAPKT